MADMIDWNRHLSARRSSVRNEDSRMKMKNILSYPEMAFQMTEFLYLEPKIRNYCIKQPSPFPILQSVRYNLVNCVNPCDGKGVPDHV